MSGYEFRKIDAPSSMIGSTLAASGSAIPYDTSLQKRFLQGRKLQSDRLQVEQELAGISRFSGEPPP